MPAVNRWFLHNTHKDCRIGFDHFKHIMAVPNQKSQYVPLPPEEREKLKEKVINQVRAVLLPEKHGMLLDNLNSK